MKNLLYILILLSQAVFAQSAFDKGNELYRQGKFSEAIKSYENIPDKGEESDEVYFNLGNAYYKLNKVAPAIYNYEKALMLDPGNSDIRTNLRFAQSLTVDDITPVKKEGLLPSLKKIDVDIWAWISIGFAFLAASCFTAYYLAKKQWVKWTLMSLFLLLSLSLVAAVIATSTVANANDAERPAIVFAVSTEVKGEPVATAPDAFTLHEGTKVNVEESLEDWSKIRLADEKVGWIKTEVLKFIK